MAEKTGQDDSAKAPGKKAPAKRAPSKKAPAKKSPGKRSAAAKPAAGKPAAKPAQAAAESLLELADRLQAAEEEAVEAAAEESEPWVSFRLTGRIYGLPVTAVQEVLRVGSITPVPHAPAAVRGVTNMRGRVLPVIDLGLRLGLVEVAVTEHSRILVVTAQATTVGLLVDAVEQMVQLLPSRVEAPPRELRAATAEITGIYPLDEAVMALLDGPSLLDLGETRAAAAAGS